MNFMNILQALNLVSIIDHIASLVSAVKLYRSKLNSDERLRVSMLGLDMAKALAQGDVIKVTALASDRSMDFSYIVPSKEVCKLINEEGQLSSRKVSKRSVFNDVKEGWSFCHIAAAFGDETILRLLVSSAAPVNLVDVHSRTPLHISYMFGCMTCARVLEQSGANPSHKHYVLGRNDDVFPRILLSEQSVLKAAEAHRYKDLSLIVYLTTEADETFIADHFPQRVHDIEDEVYFNRRIDHAASEKLNDSQKTGLLTKVRNTFGSPSSASDYGHLTPLEELNFDKFMDGGKENAFERVLRGVEQTLQWNSLFDLIAARFSRVKSPLQIQFGGDASEVKLDDAAADALAMRIFKYRSILPKRYVLQHNNIGDTGAKALADSLEQLGKEKERSEALTDSTAKERSTGFYCFDLSDNNISEKGVLALLKSVFSFGAPVSELDLRGNLELKKEYKVTVSSIVNLDDVKGELVSLFLPKPCQWGISAEDRSLPFGGSKTQDDPKSDDAMQSNRLSNHDIPVICAIMAKHKNATALDFSNSSLEAPALQVLAKCLMVPAVKSRIKELNINNNRWLKDSGAGGQQNAHLVFENFVACLANSAVVKLDACSCRLGNSYRDETTPMHALMMAIDSRSNVGGGSVLQFLDLSDNGIDASAAMCVIGSLKNGSLPHLRSLDVSDNRKFFETNKEYTQTMVSDQFSLAFQKCENMIKINISNTGIEGSCDGLSLLLEKTKSLKWLDLSNNKLYDSGATPWLAHLDAKSKLRFFDLSRCYLTSHFCLKNVSQSLLTNKTLCAVNLHSNNSNEEAPLVSMLQSLDDEVNNIVDRVRWFSHIPCGDSRAIGLVCSNDCSLSVENTVALRLEFSDDCTLIVDATSSADIEITFADRKKRKSFSFVNETMQHKYSGGGSGDGDERRPLAVCDLKVVRINNSPKVDNDGPTAKIARHRFLSIRGVDKMQPATTDANGKGSEDSLLVSIRHASSKFCLNLSIGGERRIDSVKRFCGFEEDASDSSDDSAFEYTNSPQERNKAMCALDVRCNFGPVGCIILSRLVSLGCPFLTSVNISGNKIGPKVVARFCDAVLSSHVILVKLDISSNQIGYDGSKAIADLLTHDGTLHTLNLSENGIDSYGALLLADALRENTTLLHLDLSNNEEIQRPILLKGQTVKERCDDVFDVRMELQKELLCVDGKQGKEYVVPDWKLQSSDTGRSPRFSSVVAAAALESDFFPERSGLSSLALALRANTTLLTLVISNGTCKDMSATQAEDFKTLLEGAKCSLTSLDLSSNQLGKECYGLLDAFEENMSVTRLILRDNFLSSEGCRRLCDKLDDNVTLLEVDLSNNHITGVDTSKYLAVAIARNQSITRLDVSSNDISDTDLEAIYEHIATLKKGSDDVSIEDLVAQFESEVLRFDGVTKLYNLYRRKVLKKRKAEVRSRGTRGVAVPASPRLLASDLKSAASASSLKSVASSPRAGASSTKTRKLTYHPTSTDDAKSFYDDYLRRLKEQTSPSRFAISELLCHQLSKLVSESSLRARERRTPLGGRNAVVNTVSNIPYVIIEAMSDLLFIEMDEAVKELCYDQASENENENVQRRHTDLVWNVLVLCQVGEDKWRPKIHFATFAFLEQLLYRYDAAETKRYRATSTMKYITDSYSGMCESLLFAATNATSATTPRIIFQIAKTLVIVTQFFPDSTDEDTDYVHTVLANNTEKCAAGFISALKTVRSQEESFDSSDEFRATQFDLLTLIQRLLRQGSPGKYPKATFDAMIAKDLVVDLHDMVASCPYEEVKVAALQVIDSCTDTDEFLFKLTQNEEENEEVTRTSPAKIQRPLVFAEIQLLLNWDVCGEIAATTEEEKQTLVLAARILSEVALFKADAILKFPDFLRRSLQLLKAAVRHDELAELATNVGCYLRRLAAKSGSVDVFVTDGIPTLALEALRDFQSRKPPAGGRLQEHICGLLYHVAHRMDDNGRALHTMCVSQILEPWSTILTSLQGYGEAEPSPTSMIEDHYVALVSACFALTHSTLLFGNEEPLVGVNESFERSSLFPAVAKAAGHEMRVPNVVPSFSSPDSALSLLHIILHLIFDHAYVYERDVNVIFRDGRRVKVKFNDQINQYSSALCCVSETCGRQYVEYDNGDRALFTPDKVSATYVDYFSRDFNLPFRTPHMHLKHLFLMCYRLCRIAVATKGDTAVDPLFTTFRKLLCPIVEPQCSLGLLLEDVITEGALNCISILSSAFIVFQNDDIFRRAATRKFVAWSSDADKVFEAAVRYLSVSAWEDERLLEDLARDTTVTDFFDSPRLGQLLNSLLSTPVSVVDDCRTRVCCQAFVFSLFRRMSKHTLQGPSPFKLSLVSSLVSRIELLTKCACDSICGRSHPAMLTETLFTLTRRSLLRMLEDNSSADKDYVWENARALLCAVDCAVDVAKQEPSLFAVLNHAVLEVGRVIGVSKTASKDIDDVRNNHTGASKALFSREPKNLSGCLLALYHLIAKTREAGFFLPSLLPLFEYLFCVLRVSGKQFQEPFAKFVLDVVVFDEIFLLLFLAPTAPRHQRRMALRLICALVQIDQVSNIGQVVQPDGGVVALLVEALCSADVQENAAAVMEEFEQSKNKQDTMLWRKHCDAACKLLFESDDSLLRVLNSLHSENKRCRVVTLRLLQRSLSVDAHVKNRVLKARGSVFRLLSFDDSVDFFNVLTGLFYRMLPDDRELTLVQNDWLQQGSEKEEEVKGFLERELVKVDVARDELAKRGSKLYADVLARYDKMIDTSDPYNEIVDMGKRLRDHLERSLDKVSDERKRLYEDCGIVQKISELSELYVPIFRAVALCCGKNADTYDLVRRELIIVESSKGNKKHPNKDSQLDVFLRTALRIVSNLFGVSNDQELYRKDWEIITHIKTELSDLDAILERKYSAQMRNRKDVDFCGSAFARVTLEYSLETFHLLLMAMVRFQEFKSVARCSELCLIRIGSERGALSLAITALADSVKTRKMADADKRRQGVASADVLRYAVSVDEPDIESRRRRLWHVTKGTACCDAYCEKDNFFTGSCLTKKRFFARINKGAPKAIESAAFLFIEHLVANSTLSSNPEAVNGGIPSQNCEILAHLGEYMFRPGEDREKGDQENDGQCTDADYSDREWVEKLTDGLNNVLCDADNAVHRRPQIDMLTRTSHMLRLVRLIVENRSSWDDASWFFERDLGILGALLKGGEYFVRHVKAESSHVVVVADIDIDVVKVIVQISEILDILVKTSRNVNLLLEVALTYANSCCGSESHLPAAVRYQVLMMTKTCCERVGASTAKELLKKDPPRGDTHRRRWRIFDELLSASEYEWESISATMSSFERYFMPVNFLCKKCLSGAEESERVQYFDELKEVLSVDANWTASFINSARLDGNTDDDDDYLTLSVSEIPQNAFDALIHLFYFCSSEIVRRVTSIVLSILSTGDWGDGLGVVPNPGSIEQVLMSGSERGGVRTLVTLGLERLITARDENKTPLFAQRLRTLMTNGVGGGDGNALPVCWVLAYALKQSPTLRTTLHSNIDGGGVALMIEKAVGLLDTQERSTSTIVSSWVLEIAHDLIADDELVRRSLLEKEDVRVRALWETCSAFLMVSGSTADTPHLPALTVRTASSLLKVIAHHCKDDYELSSTLTPLLPTIVLGHRDRDVVANLLDAMFYERMKGPDVAAVQGKRDDDEHNDDAEENENENEEGERAGPLDYCKKRTRGTTAGEDSFEPWEKDILLWKKHVFGNFEPPIDSCVGLDYLMLAMTAAVSVGARASPTNRDRQKKTERKW